MRTFYCDTKSAWTFAIWRDKIMPVTLVITWSRDFYALCICANRDGKTLFSAIV